MNLLVVSSWCPYPSDNGSRLRAYHLIRQLARRGHRIKLLALAQEESDLAAAQSGLSPLCALGVELFPSRFFRPGTVRALLGFFSTRPRHLLDTHQPEAARRIARECRSGDCDAVLALELGVAHYVPSGMGVPCMLEQLEVSGFVKAVREAPSPRARLRRALTLAKLRRHLASLGERYAVWTAVSEAEAQAIQTLVGPAAPPVRVLPNGVDLDGNSYDPAAAYDPEGLIYNGALGFSANLDAVRWFSEEILPIIQKERPGVRLRVTGRNDVLPPDDPLRRHPGIELTGYLDDVRPAVRGAAACAAPLRQGGGTRLKILEAMALGTPVVTTSRGAEGIAARDGQEIFIADAPADFAAAVLRLMADRALRARAGAAGRRLVEDRYGWDAVGVQMATLLENFTRVENNSLCLSDKP
ncbi:MAG: glycosyltransferase [Armatimonadetes bacterium]|nr:glycosyltransferase [Armatimonadota bacterium]